jgi:hypothetical protein
MVIAATCALLLSSSHCHNMLCNTNKCCLPLTTSARDKTRANMPAQCSPHALCLYTSCCAKVMCQQAPTWFGLASKGCSYLEVWSGNAVQSSWSG